MTATHIQPTPAQEKVIFEQLLREEGPRVLAFARHGCGDGSDAEDIAQETFLQAFRARDQLQDPTRARAWLLTIARRVCQRLHRHRAGEPAHFETLSALWPRPEASVPYLSSVLESPLDASLRAEAQELVEDGISRIPAPFRGILVLADIAELTSAEIAVVLGLKEATVKTRLHRARLKLRALLAAGLPKRPAGPSNHSRAVCLELLRAKLEAMDRKVAFPYPNSALCDRCRTQLGLLDLAAGLCPMLAAETMPEELRQRLAAIS